MAKYRADNIWDLISILKWGGFGRINLMWITPFDAKRKHKKQIEADIAIARAENAETDQYIREYVKKAEDFAVKDLPF